MDYIWIHVTEDMLLLTKQARHVCGWSRGHPSYVKQGTQGMLAREHQSTQGTLAREHVGKVRWQITLAKCVGKWAHEHARRVGTWTTFELQMLLRCCLIRISNITARCFLYSLYLVSMSQPTSIYVVSLSFIFHLHLHFHYD